LKIGKSKINGGSKRMKTLKKTFAISAVAAMLVLSTLLVAVQAQSAQGELGKDIASGIREIVEAHKADVQEFIMQAKVDGAESEEEKLAIVEQYVDALRAKVDELKATREQLVAEGLPDEEFAMEMKGLALEIAAVARAMGTIGEELGELGQSTATAIRESVAAQVVELQGLAGEIAAIGLSIAEDMSGKDLPVPEFPELPDVSQLPGLPVLPGLP
jgi:hypothetical protein